MLQIIVRRNILWWTIVRNHNTKFKLRWQNYIQSKSLQQEFNRFVTVCKCISLQYLHLIISLIDVHQDEPLTLDTTVKHYGHRWSEVKFTYK